MLKGSKWYRVIGDTGLSASTSIEGIREKDDRVQPGAIVPREWFADTPDDVCELLLLPVSIGSGGGFGALEPYQPGDAELEALYMKFPGARPAPKARRTRKKKETTQEG